MTKFRKKPVIIDAWQWDGSTNWSTAPEWLQEVVPHWSPKELAIPTLEGTMRAMPGDWLIRGVKGEVYPCKPDIFEATYEKSDRRLQEREVSFQIQIKRDGCWWTIGEGFTIADASKNASGKEDYRTLPHRTVCVTVERWAEIIEGEKIYE